MNIQVETVLTGIGTPVTKDAIPKIVDISAVTMRITEERSGKKARDIAKTAIIRTIIVIGNVPVMNVNQDDPLILLTKTAELRREIIIEEGFRIQIGTERSLEVVRLMNTAKDATTTGTMRGAETRSAIVLAIAAAKEMTAVIRALEFRTKIILASESLKAISLDQEVFPNETRFR